MTAHIHAWDRPSRAYPRSRACACGAVESQATRGIRAVLRLAKRYGVEVRDSASRVMCPEHDEEGTCYHGGPIAGGICVKSWVIYWPAARIASPQPADDLALLHELAHVLDVDAETPEHTLELDGAMLAFEYHAGRRIGLRDRGRWMDEFEIDGERNWNGLTVRERSTYLQMSLVKAQHIGILSSDGTPKYFNPRRASA